MGTESNLPGGDKRPNQTMTVMKSPRSSFTRFNTLILINLMRYVLIASLVGFRSGSLNKSKDRSRKDLAFLSLKEKNLKEIAVWLGLKKREMFSMRLLWAMASPMPFVVSPIPSARFGMSIMTTVIRQLLKFRLNLPI
jgi:hypothetical protein